MPSTLSLAFDIPCYAGRLPYIDTCDRILHQEDGSIVSFLPRLLLALALAMTTLLAVSSKQLAFANQSSTRNRYLPGSVTGNHAVVNNPTHRDQKSSILIYEFPWYASPEALPYAPLPPDSAGASLLSKYQLDQTPCEEPGLVVIFGPDGSVICAYPFGRIAPGEYYIDPSNLTLVSRG